MNLLTVTTLTLLTVVMVLMVVMVVTNGSDGCDGCDFGDSGWSKCHLQNFPSASNWAERLEMCNKLWKQENWHLSKTWFLFLSNFQFRQNNFKCLSNQCVVFGVGLKRKGGEGVEEKSCEYFCIFVSLYFFIYVFNFFVFLYLIFLYFCIFIFVYFCI